MIFWWADILLESFYFIMEEFMLEILAQVVIAAFMAFFAVGSFLLNSGKDIGVR